MGGAVESSFNNSLQRASHAQIAQIRGAVREALLDMQIPEYM